MYHVMPDNIALIVINSCHAGSCLGSAATSNEFVVCHAINIQVCRIFFQRGCFRIGCRLWCRAVLKKSPSTQRGKGGGGVDSDTFFLPKKSCRPCESHRGGGGHGGTPDFFFLCQKVMSTFHTRVGVSSYITTISDKQASIKKQSKRRCLNPHNTTLPCVHGYSPVGTSPQPNGFRFKIGAANYEV